MLNPPSTTFKNPRHRAGVSFGGWAVEESDLPQFNVNKISGVRNPTHAPATTFDTTGCTGCGFEQDGTIEAQASDQI